VTVTGRGEERLRGFAEQLGFHEGLLTVAGNAAEYDHVQAAVEATLKELGRLDTVVANAGSATHDTVAESDPAGPSTCRRDPDLARPRGDPVLGQLRQPAAGSSAERGPARRVDRLGDRAAERRRCEHRVVRPIGQPV
jgi:hypothetical protein